MKKYLAPFALFTALFAQPALAVDSLQPLNDLSAVTESYAKLMVQTVALSADHRAYMPATPQGLLVGLDFGVQVTAVSVPTDFATALSVATGKPVADLPAVIPVPMLSVHKGLPGKIDLGFGYAAMTNASTNEQLFRIYGGDIKWAPIGGGVLPAVALRLSGSYAKLWFMSTRTYAIDALVSKNLSIIDPYVGAGLKFWSGDLQVPVATMVPGGLNVPSHYSSSNPHIFAGLPLKLLLLRLTLEADYNFAGITTYGAKVSFGF